MDEQKTTPEISQLLEVLEEKVKKMAAELVSLRDQYADLQSRFHLLEEENKRAKKILSAHTENIHWKSQLLSRLKKISEKLSEVN